MTSSLVASLWAPPRAAAVEPPRPPEPPTPPPIPDPRPRWIGTSHFTRGRSGQTVRAVVIHTVTGTLGGTDSWLQNPGAGVSYHYAVGLQGQQHQYVALSDTAWANGILESGNRWPGAPSNVNAQTVAIGTEDLNNPNQAVTDAQFQAVLECANLAVRTFPSIRWLLGHHVISPQSRACPWPRWRTSGRLTALANRLNLQLVN